MYKPNRPTQLLNRLTPFSIQECLKSIPNIFELTLVAAQRARELNKEGVPMFRTEALKEISFDMLDKEEYLMKSVANTKPQPKRGSK